VPHWPLLFELPQLPKVPVTGCQPLLSPVLQQEGALFHWVSKPLRSWGREVRFTTCRLPQVLGERALAAQALLPASFFPFHLICPCHRHFHSPSSFLRPASIPHHLHSVDVKWQPREISTRALFCSLCYDNCPVLSVSACKFLSISL